MYSQPAHDFPAEDEMNLRSYWCVVVKHRVLILGIICMTTILTAVFTLLQPNIYVSKTTLMPLGQARSGLQAALGEARELLPLGALPGGREGSAERLLAVLQSRTLAVDVIQHLYLLPLLFAKEWDAERQQWKTAKPPTVQDAVRALGGMVSITSSKHGVITTAVEDADPVLAAAIANRYIDALHSTMNAHAGALASKHRAFIEAQMARTSEELTAAEEALRRFKHEGTIMALDAQPPQRPWR